MMTAEDSVAFEPSLVIRRRFVGNPNGTVGIRGAGMFQTARSMVFADGLPLYYLMQLRGTIAYEKRVREEDDKQNYLRDGVGSTYWDASPATFEERFQDRNSLLLGFGISGELARDWIYDIYTTDFDIRKDEERRTGLNTGDFVSDRSASRGKTTSNALFAQ